MTNWNQSVTLFTCQSCQSLETLFETNFTKYGFIMVSLKRITLTIIQSHCTNLVEVRTLRNVQLSLEISWNFIFDSIYWKLKLFPIAKMLYEIFHWGFNCQMNNSASSRELCIWFGNPKGRWMNKLHKCTSLISKVKSVQSNSWIIYFTDTFILWLWFSNVL